MSSVLSKLMKIKRTAKLGNLIQFQHHLFRHTIIRLARSIRTWKMIRRIVALGSLSYLWNCWLYLLFASVQIQQFWPMVCSNQCRFNWFFSFLNRFRISHKFLESMALNWEAELRKYWSMIEEQTEATLQLIKKDSIRRGLQFDVKFKETFLQLANSRYD